MGDYTYDTIIKDTPIFAKNNTPVSKEVEPKSCGACKSKNTICIYNEVSGSIIGWSSEEEFLCKDCGKYTAYINDYES